MSKMNHQTAAVIGAGRLRRSATSSMHALANKWQAHAGYQRWRLCAKMDLKLQASSNESELAAFGRTLTIRLW
jgi:hypothetical protein